MNRPTVLDRYLNKIDSSDPNGCWPWRQSVGKFGYGKFRVQDSIGQWITMDAHRWGYINLIGPISDGLVVRHTCDNPPCNRLDHWVLGTQADNLRDMVSRSRNFHAQGELSGMSKLTERQVRDIKRRFATGQVLQRELADEYSVVTNTISRIVTGRRWGHVQ